jgi:hypothetical protein
MQSFKDLDSLQKLMGLFPFWCLEIGAEKVLSTSLKLLFRFFQLLCFF